MLQTKLYFVTGVHRSRRVVWVIVAGFGLSGLEFKFYKITIGICQEGHPEFEVLRCSSKTFGTKASV